MATRTTGLTAIQVAKAKPGKHADGRGLYLKVKDNGSKYWMMRFSRNGRTREVGLGSASVISLAEARRLAAPLWLAHTQGRDVVADRKAERLEQQLAEARQMTFADAAKGYVEAHGASWRSDKHRANWINSMATYTSKIATLPVADVTKQDVLRALKPYWKTRQETASRVRGRIECVLEWAAAEGYRDENMANPAAWRGLRFALSRPDRKLRVKHHSALPHGELPGFYAKLVAMEGRGALALRFTILTAARTGEVIGACWREIDFERKVWSIPAERMKEPEPHRVPLSDEALAILQLVRPDEIDGADSIFAVGDAAMYAVLRRLKVDTVITVHGFRSSFRDWCADSGVPREIAEAALAHAVGAVEGAYFRSDVLQRRRAVMDQWASHVTTLPDEKGKVLAFARPLEAS